MVFGPKLGEPGPYDHTCWPLSSKFSNTTPFITVFFFFKFMNLFKTRVAKHFITWIRPHHRLSAICGDLTVASSKSPRKCNQSKSKQQFWAPTPASYREATAMAFSSFPGSAQSIKVSEALNPEVPLPQKGTSSLHEATRGGSRTIPQNLGHSQREKTGLLEPLLLLEHQSARCAGDGGFSALPV